MIMEHIFNRQLVKEWQKEFEDRAVMTPPEIYNFHAYVKKDFSTPEYRLMIVSDIVSFYLSFFVFCGGLINGDIVLDQCKDKSKRER